MNEILMTIAGTSGAALLNFFGTKIYNKATGENKNMLWKDSTTELSTFKANLDFSELKKRTRIVVIDDEDSFPVNLFQDEGYSIDKWDRVKDYGKLESGFYDIIVLDIQGVADHISADDGLGVLESIKNHNPAQIIIAFSQHSFDLSKSKFWELADEKIAKPSDFLKIKKIIDNLISTKFKPERYINTLKQVLRKNNVSEKDITKIEASLSKTIENKDTPNWKKIVESINSKTELTNQVISLGSTIIKFFQ